MSRKLPRPTVRFSGKASSAGSGAANKPRAGLRPRGALAVVAAIAVVVFGVFGYSRQRLSTSSAKEANASAIAVARGLAHGLTAADLRRPDLLKLRLETARSANPDLRSVSVDGRSGGGRGIHATSTSKGTQQRSLDISQRRLRRGRRLTIIEVDRGSVHLLRLTAPVRSQGRLIAALHLDYSMARHDAALAQRKKELAVSLALAALVIVLLYLALGRAIYRPIEKLRQATQRIMSGEGGTRLNWRRSDEIGMLARDFDRMAATLEENESRLTTRALQDPLTGLPNKRGYEDQVTIELRRALREYYPVSIVAIDIDSFKGINDSWGHAVGDDALQKFARAIRSKLRGSDICGRVGGDEFMLALVRTSAREAQEFLERLRPAVALVEVGPSRLHITFSAGIAEFPRHGTDQAQLVRLADAAMYWGKSNGRDRYTVHHSHADEGLPANSARQIQERSLLNTVHALARAVDAKDGYTHSHSQRVSTYAASLAESLGVKEERVEQIRTAGLLHDVGKIGIPDAVLLKRRPLTLEERAVMQRHSELGKDILTGAGMPDVALWVCHLHERYDGRGYPGGLAGEDIPFESRVLHAADALEAMTRTRIYRPALPLDKALEELEECAGTQFDPEVALRLVELVRKEKLRIEIDVPKAGPLQPFELSGYGS